MRVLPGKTLQEVDEPYVKVDNATTGAEVNGMYRGAIIQL